MNPGNPFKNWLCGFFTSHRRRAETRSGYCSPEMSWHVADEFTETRIACACGEHECAWKRERIGGINSLTLSSDDWHRLKRDGVLYR